MTSPKVVNSSQEFWENRDVRINRKTGLIEVIISWTTEDETIYVKELGMGKHNPGTGPGL